MKILWCLKQLLPLTYRTLYASEGRIIYHTWKMWFGRCYSQEWVTVAPPTSNGDVSDNLLRSIEWLRCINPEKEGPIVHGDGERPPLRSHHG